MSRIRATMSAALVSALVPVTTAAQHPGVQFPNVASTASGYSTWDLDIIDAERRPQTGRGVYIAVFDSGLVPNWRDYFPAARIATELVMGFEQGLTFTTGRDDLCGFSIEAGPLRRTGWIGSVGSTHGTVVTSAITGFFYQNPFDAAAGFPLPPIVVRGSAPESTIIPVKVMFDQRIPAVPECG